ncbi:phenylalanine--tRNA ligase subunit beta [Rugosimonospora acidiphila]|uniref:Phenylalanine--tRNA ligase beta subunit n=1 Tax=Rugosimonospora acidiphila TaxID=556531 RepID=A0ABP9SMY9_9ACTN
MRIAISWLREYVDVPVEPDALERALVGMGLEVEEIVDLRTTVTGPLVLGRVLSAELLTGFKKPIRYCQVDVGEAEPRGIVCGAPNVAEGETVVVALPGAVLPGDFAIAARKTYGKVSDGMICSVRELGLGDDHAGIMVIPPSERLHPGDDARPVVGLDDIVVELEITPDRGYCHSARGIARELSHAFGVPLRDPARIDAPGATEPSPYPITVDDPVGCDRFAVRMVRGIDPAAQAPQWMKQRLSVAGIRSISLAVDITNYVMLELGQPMHAFDPNRLAGPLLVRRARAGERLTTLDGVDRELDGEDMVICDTGLDNPLAPGAGLPVSLAAVMGGENSEMQPDSVDVLFEAAHWDPVMVSRTARRHRLLSEAAKRWERGVDPQLPLVALQRAVTLMTEFGGGRPEPGVLDLDHVVAPRPIVMPSSLPGRVAGIAYPEQRVAQLLQEVGCAVSPGQPAEPGPAAVPALVVTPPTWRPDLLQPADLVEEVVRLDGYNKIESVLPAAPAGNGLTPTQRRRRTVGRALAEAGFVEALSYPFVAAGALDALGLPDDDSRRAAVRLANPLSDEEPLLRTTLLPPLLGTVRRNLGRGQRDVALFELGTVFLRRPDQPAAPAMGVDGRPSESDLAATEAAIPHQPWHVAAVLVGDVERAGWWGAGRTASWADAIEAARTTVDAAGARVTVRAAQRAPWHPGRCAEFVLAGQAGEPETVVGYAGELHPAVCEAFELPRGSAAMELDLDALPLPGIVAAPDFSTYPPALIDVAVVVDATTPAAAVQDALVTGAGPLLETVRLFDVYSSEQLGEGRKSLAYKLTFRAPDRTLTGDEAVAARDAAVAEAARRVGAVLRGA